MNLNFLRTDRVSPEVPESCGSNPTAHVVVLQVLVSFCYKEPHFLFPILNFERTKRFSNKMPCVGNDFLALHYRAVYIGIDIYSNIYDIGNKNTTLECTVYKTSMHARHLIN